MDTTAVTTCTPLWWVMPTIASIALLVSVTAVAIAYFALKNNRAIAAEKAMADRKTAKLKNTADVMMKWRTTPQIKEGFDILREIHNSNEHCIEGLAKADESDKESNSKKVKIVFLLNFIEDIAAGARHDIYDVDLIESSICTVIRKSWGMSVPFVYKHRETQPKLYENIEWLLQQFKS